MIENCYIANINTEGELRQIFNILIKNNVLCACKPINEKRFIEFTEHCVVDHYPIAIREEMLFYNSGYIGNSIFSVKTFPVYTVNDFLNKYSPISTLSIF